MAYNQNAAAGSNNAENNWKSSGFINFYLPSKDGKRRKLGAIGLKDSRENEKALMDWLASDEKNIQKLVKKLVIEYQSATPAASAAFDLG